MGQADADRVGDDRPSPVAPLHRPQTYDRAAFPELECVRNLLAAETLAAAAKRATELGIGADRVLIASGAIDEETFLHRLSLRFGIRRGDFADVARDDLTADDAGILHAAQTGLLHVRANGRLLTFVCLRDDRARRIVRVAIDAPREVGHLRLVTEAAFHEFLLFRTNALIDRAVNDLRMRYPALSAAPHVELSTARRMARWGRLALSALLGILAIVMFPRAVGDLLALLFLAGITVRFVASLLPARTRLLQRDRDADLPDYSVIVALYREAPVVPQLLTALSALDYPPEKLDILLVVETDDLATRAAIARARPSSSFRTIVAPNRGPRTKPKALNVALPFARGKYVAVFDAEDRPDPDQLRKALAAFRNGGNDLACVQARLAVDNADDSLFSAMFAAEYAGQFDIVMPGYDRAGLPWPLGGTSNHFDACKLREAGAWDPFNVTEDADLGLRFARFRFSMAAIDSTTWEEATVGYRAWQGQRTRWMKGWIQTWRVHMRHPLRYWRRTGWSGLVARDLMIGVALLAALAFPLLAIVGCGVAYEYLETGDGWHALALVRPLHWCSLCAGLTVSILVQARGLARRGLLRHVWVLAFTPLYWGCLSAAAWRAVWEAWCNPYHWEKTAHGVKTQGVNAAARPDRVQKYFRKSAAASSGLRSSLNGATKRPSLSIR